MKKKIIGTEFTGKHNQIKATGVLKEMGIKEFYSLKGENLAELLHYLLTSKPEGITEHTYRLGRYMLKFYPPESFGFLLYCQGLGLAVENPLAMGINQRNEGDILIVDKIDGRDYREIILENRKTFFFRRVVPSQEMEALGKLVYLFCSKGICAGDSKLQNFMHDGKEAIRIDLIPHQEAMLNINWDEISGDLVKANEKEEELIVMLSDIFCILRDTADILTHQPQSQKRLLQALKAFLKGFSEDDLSRIIALQLRGYIKDLVTYMQEAEKKAKSFQEVFWSHVLESAAEKGDTVTIRLFEH